MEGKRSEYRPKSSCSGTGSTLSTMTRIHQLSRNEIEPEIRYIRCNLVIMALAVLVLGIGIVVYIRQVTQTVVENSISVWVAS